MVDISTINRSYWTYFNQLIANELGTTRRDPGKHPEDHQGEKLRAPLLQLGPRRRVLWSAGCVWPAKMAGLQPLISWGISPTILLGHSGIQWDMVRYSGI